MLTLPILNGRKTVRWDDRRKFSPPLYTVKDKNIRLFIKPYCGWCDKATNWLDKRGVSYEEIDVIADESAFDEMIRLSGQECASVIDIDGEILADFGPDQLATFWEKLEKRDASA